MRTITLKYEGDCEKCSVRLMPGESAVYEKRVGIFCPTCAPTDPEEIRTYRQEGADRKADKYEDWAAKRERRANITLNNHKEIRSDIAFNTQPGHIPFRARLIAADDRAFQSLNVAEGFRTKAASLRHVRVAGDAEQKRQAKRDAVKAVLRVGMRVDTVIYGEGIVEKINKKTATIGSTGTSRTYKTTVDLSFLRPLEEIKP